MYLDQDFLDHVNKDRWGKVEGKNKVYMWHKNLATTCLRL